MALQKCTLLGKQHQWYPFAIAQHTRRKGADTQHHGADKTGQRAGQPEPSHGHPEHLLAQQVRELNARQKAAKKEGASGAGTMKDLKEATAVLKDLAGVAKT